MPTLGNCIRWARICRSCNPTQRAVEHWLRATIAEPPKRPQNPYKIEHPYYVPVVMGRGGGLPVGLAGSRPGVEAQREPAQRSA